MAADDSGRADRGQIMRLLQATVRVWSALYKGDAKPLVDLKITVPSSN